MNRGAAAPGGGAAAAAVKEQKALLCWIETDISVIVDTFSRLVNLARTNEPPVRNLQDAFQLEIRAARMVQAADSLQSLVLALKQTAIFSGLRSLNENVDQRIAEFDQLADDTERLLESVGEQATANLKELEKHYYSSFLRTSSGGVQE